MQRPLVISLFLVAATLFVYAPTATHGFVDFDDTLYVTENPVVRAGLTAEGVRWAFELGPDHAASWLPLTWLSHMLDVELFGLRAGPAHLESALLHALSAVLLFLALRRATGASGRSAFVAALFALHPLRVESVAWVSGRKDVLSGLFWMLALGAHVRFAERPSKGRGALVALWMALGLACKQVLVTLPLALLLLDVWPLGRLRGGPAPARPGASPTPEPLARLVLEKLPLLVLAVLGSVAAWLAQRSGAEQSTLELVPVGPLGRLANALVAYAAYLGKTVWPFDLAVFYPHRGDATAFGPALFAGVLLLAISALAWRLRRPAPYVAVGWLWFLGTLVPMIGFVTFGLHAMADRFTYVPQIGLFLALAFGVPDLVARLARRPVPLAVPAGAVLVALAGLAAAQTRVWRDTRTLFEHAARVVPQNHLAHQNLGLYLLDHGELAGARQHFEAALAIEPGDYWSNVNLGGILAQGGEPARALPYFERATEVSPEGFEARASLGMALATLGRLDAAARELERAAALRPDDPAVQRALAGVRASAPRGAPTLPELEARAARAPDDADARFRLGVALTNAGRSGVAEFEAATRLRPDWYEAWMGLGVALGQDGQAERAVEASRRAIELRPGDALGRYHLGANLARAGERAAARAAFQEARRLAEAAGQTALLARIDAALGELGS